MKINNENYVDEAEKVIKELKVMKDKHDKTMPMVTTSKIRNLLAMAADIYNDVSNSSSERLNADVCSRIEYLRVRVIYEAGREQTVKNFVEKAGLINILKSINGEKKNYILFNRYMEALVAFHRFYGGKDM